MRRRWEIPMFDRRMFADMKRAGFDVGVSKTKLAQAMLEVLAQLPGECEPAKEIVVARLGMVGQMSATRDVNAAWNDAKKAAARRYPDRFVLDSRKVLRRNDGSIQVLDKSISTDTFRKLNEQAAAEGCSVNQFVSRLVREHQRHKAEQAVGRYRPPLRSGRTFNGTVGGEDTP
jgi:hypothetical protein